MTLTKAKLVTQLVHDVLLRRGYGHLWKGERTIYAPPVGSVEHEEL